MKKFTFLPLILLFSMICLIGNSQPNDVKGFKMTGINPAVIVLSQNIPQTTELQPFGTKSAKIYGLAISGEVVLNDDKSQVRVILVDKNYHEYLVYEMYSLLADNQTVTIDEISEETCQLDGIQPQYLRVEVVNAILKLDKITIAGALPPGLDIALRNRENHQLRNEEKIKKLNRNLQSRGLSWAAGITDVSALSYAEKKLLYGQSTFPPGIEYYVGGVIQDGEQLKAATASPMADKWDWRSRHGKNWISPVKNQASCGSCWAFAVTGATEAQVNLYFNQVLNMDLSEQNVLSCSGAGTCAGGYPSSALNYIAGAGMVDEAAFPYTATDQPCTNKSVNPSQLIKIAGKVDFGTSSWPQEEDVLKKMIIKYGPVSGGVYDWSHAMTLVGWQVVKEGDRFCIRDLNKSIYWITVPAGSPLIGTTVWIFKNSWGNWGDAGYVYLQTTMSNIGWTHALLNPVVSVNQSYPVVCEDSDGDGYYWWGLGSKPAGCASCPDTPDGDDSNPALGPLDSYGNCMVLGGPPVADFSADKTTVSANNIVNFTDLSTNTPTSWAWTFEGGTPATSSLKDPVISYNTPGTFPITLTATNTGGSSSLTKTDYIVVTDTVYCNSNGYAVAEWIASASLGSNTNTSGSSGSAGYQDFTGIKFTVEAGSAQNIVLTPKFSSRNKTLTEFWTVWIDYNGDKDFGDNGEQVFTRSGNTGVVSGTILIPAGIERTTIMRVSMKRNAVPASCEIFTQGEVEDYTLKISPPVILPLNAEFSASSTTLTVGGSVQFTDVSTGFPSSWNWSFPGSTSETSSLQNPKIQYLSKGVYSVVLHVSKDGTTDTETKTAFIIVNPASEYCVPTGINSARDYIKGVVLGGISKTAGGTGYSIDPGTWSFVPGQTYAATLTPATITNRNYWKIWIDFNCDGDFDDAGETLLNIPNKKGAFTSNVVIPATASGATRLRISMRTGASPVPCNDNFNGEVEDYTVSFGSAAITMKIANIETADGFKPGNLRVYPNPADQKLTIQLDNVFSGDNFSVYNTLGMLLAKEQIGETITILDVANFVPGIYLILVDNGNTSFREKFVKR